MIVIDASVAVKWFAPEAAHDLALRILDSGQRLIAPDFIVAEVASALCKKLKNNEVSEEQARQAISDLPGYFDRLLPLPFLIEKAFGLSRDLDHSIYDCVYLACAIEFQSTLVTCDEPLLTKCRGGGYGDRAVALVELTGRLIDEAVADVELLSGELLRIQDLSEQTWRSICDALGVRAEGGNFGRMTPTFDLLEDSFPQRRLLDLLRQMEPHSLAATLAVAWYGRGTDDDLPRAYRRALDFLGSDPSHELHYVASQVRNLELGLGKLSRNVSASPP